VSVLSKPNGINGAARSIDSENELTTSTSAIGELSRKRRIDLRRQVEEFYRSWKTRPTVAKASRTSSRASC
jgi:hypothetical protein